MVRHSSTVELSRSALRQNLEFLRERIGPHAEFSLVVKANAYGHGIAQIVPLAERSGVRHFSVASSYEAQAVLEARTEDSAIMVMGILYDEDLPWVLENELEFYVFERERLDALPALARRVGVPARVHLEVETGGNRTGLPLSDLGDALKTLKREQRWLRFEGLCSHFAGIETLANQFRIQRQEHTFDSVLQRVNRAGLTPRRRHLACSAAALAFPRTALDLVRVGTAAYGIWPSPDVYNLFLAENGRPKRNPLHRVLTWKTNVMSLKPVKQDEFVGYGTAFQAYRDMTVAVLPIGYSNGYPRDLSNRGHVLVRGRKAPIVGLVNMNMFMVDVSHVPEVAVGDEVVLVGRQRKNVISLRSFTEFSDKLNNEFVSRLPAAIPRQTVR